jgi:hypothetical protein
MSVTSEAIVPNPTNPTTSEKSGFLPHHLQHPGQLFSTDPHSWTVSEVSDWLESKYISTQIIQAFQNKSVTGSSLFVLTEAHMVSMGIHLIGTRLHLAALIEELRCGANTSGGGGVGESLIGGSLGGGGYVGVEMEDGNEPFENDAPPPSYST